MQAVCNEIPCFLFFPFFAKGFENGYHGYCILWRAGHNEGIADKAEVDSLASGVATR